MWSGCGSHGLHEAADTTTACRSTRILRLVSGYNTVNSDKDSISSDTILSFICGPTGNDLLVSQQAEILNNQSNFSPLEHEMWKLNFTFRYCFRKWITDKGQ